MHKTRRMENPRVGQPSAPDNPSERTTIALSKIRAFVSSLGEPKKREPGAAKGSNDYDGRDFDTARAGAGRT